jgi:hypothetical protein
MIHDLLEKLQKSIHDGWVGVKDALLSINPIPEPIRPIISSRYFWFVIWIAAFSALGRNLLGGRIGNWVGLFAGGVLWYFLAPKPSPELPILAFILIVSPFLATWLRCNKLGRRVRGVKICPDCAEEVKSKARVCKYCAYLFDTSNPRLVPRIQAMDD